jgi:glycerol-3-phosphate dehydrogenase (NAD(P)+)
VTFHAAVVIGPTAWGTMLAVLLARNEMPVTLLARTPDEAAALEAARENERRLPGTTFPPSLRVSADARALHEADLICFATPAQTVGQNAQAIALDVPAHATLLTASKGIEIVSGRRTSEVLQDVLPGRPVAALSGPNLSREVAKSLPGTTVIASADASLDDLRAAFHSASFRVYTTEDIVGVEFGGALKNIYAIAGGMVDAFEYGDNGKAAVLTRGLAEMSRLGVAAGADPLTFQGLAGIGDLIATAYGPLSRNRRLGELLGRGRSLGDALADIGETAEGSATTPAALGLARRLGVEMPIAEGLNAIMYEGLAPHAAVAALLQREPGPERAAVFHNAPGDSPARQ